MKDFLQGLFKRLMKSWVWLVLIILALAIKWASLYPEWIEKYYTYGAYPVISRSLRFIFGWIPFSAGDLFYGFVLVVIIWKTVRLFKTIFRKKFTRIFLKTALQQVIFTFLIIYVLFNLLWGLNYNRIGIAKQLGLQMTKYSVGQLDTLISTLESRLNQYVLLESRSARDSFYKKRNLFRETDSAYQYAVKTYPFLDYKNKSIKPSIFSYAGNILGFQGYYNPFSGEAQLNTTVPVFTQPFIACHEVGHQLGYGKENEANFAGFLACRAHPSAAFRYSVYFDMYQYTIREVYRRDTAKAKASFQKLNPLVRTDFEEVRKFFSKYENPIEPVITWFYSNYLKANDQPLGKETYSQVVAFLIAYQEKFGVESL